MDETIIREVLQEGLPALGMGEDRIPQLIEFSRLLLEKNQEQAGARCVFLFFLTHCIFNKKER